jgi:hypothetical protein
MTFLTFGEDRYVVFRARGFTCWSIHWPFLLPLSSTFRSHLATYPYATESIAHGLLCWEACFRGEQGPAELAQSPLFP